MRERKLTVNGSCAAVLQIDNVLDRNECAELAEWQNSRLDRLPAPPLCIPASEARHTLSTFGLGPNSIWARDRGHEEYCFSPYDSVWPLAELKYVRNFILADGAHAEGLPFPEFSPSETTPSSEVEAQMTPALKKLENFLEEALGLPREHALPFNFAAYPSGGGYGTHTDCTKYGRSRDGLNVERHVTTLLYFEDGFEGGETSFVKLGIDVVPQCGRLLVSNSVVVCDE